MKKKYIKIAGAVGLLVVAAIGGSLAASYSSTDGIGAAVVDITEGSVNVQIEGSGLTELNGSSNYIEIGSDKGCQLDLKNVSDGKNPFTMYAKVVVSSTWNDDELDEKELKDDYVGYKIDGQLVKKVETYAEQYKAGDWIVAKNDGIEMVLYYTKPIKPGEKTSNFVDSISFDKDINNDYLNGKLQFKVAAYSVQENSVTKAMPAEWGVFPKLSDSGEIVEIKEEKKE
ncbi:hypothetical protein [Lachnobacterium bovis]|uniref:SipW-cognate class signal peptide n=1 Tax=Lachnobacterium bovis TaxID=140626 RepID=A0A1H9TEN9_9FIRM|nr:hypothetical protein [Lachnobacterium bovis]SER95662.1 hypothetical protein SAMN02910429_01608 [Lachnobacterium bovis]